MTTPSPQPDAAPLLNLMPDWQPAAPRPEHLPLIHAPVAVIGPRPAPLCWLDRRPGRCGHG